MLFNDRDDVSFAAISATSHSPLFDFRRGVSGAPQVGTNIPAAPFAMAGLVRPGMPPDVPLAISAQPLEGHFAVARGQKLGVIPRRGFRITARGSQGIGLPPAQRPKI